MNENPFEDYLKDALGIDLSAERDKKLMALTDAHNKLMQFIDSQSTENLEFLTTALGARWDEDQEPRWNSIQQFVGVIQGELLRRGRDDLSPALVGA